MLEEFQAHLEGETRRKDHMLDSLVRQKKILNDVNSGVEHLADKLSHLKAVRETK